MADLWVRGFVRFVDLGLWVVSFVDLGLWWIGALICGRFVGLCVCVL